MHLGAFPAGVNIASPVLPVCVVDGGPLSSKDRLSARSDKAWTRGECHVAARGFLPMGRSAT